MSLAVAAAAEATPALWSTPNSAVVQTGDLTLKLDGGSPVTCSDVEITGHVFSAYFMTGEGQAWQCSNGTTFSLTALWQEASSDAGQYTLSSSIVSGNSPYGGYGEYATFDGAFVNGSGAVASTVSYSDAMIGRRFSDLKPITMSGTLTFTTATGGLVTLNALN